MAWITVATNVVMAALLAITIGYCWVLNRRIKILQDSKSELALLLKHFDESTLRASESIIALQTASKKIGESIQSRIDKANFVLDDLSFMIDKAHKLTDKVEASFAVNRARSRVMAEETDENETPIVKEQTASPSVEDIKPAPVIERLAPAPVSPKKTSTLEAMLTRLSGNGAAKPAKLTAEESSRSKSEQELLNMLRSGLKG